MPYQIPSLPLIFSKDSCESDLETKPILKQLVKSHKALASLKSASGVIPNENILVQTLSLQESWKSSEIENIVTTQDDLYASDHKANRFISQEAKEVYRHADALLNGYRIIKEKGFLSHRHIIDIFQTIEERDTGFRSTQVFLRDGNDNIIYTPPDKHDDIVQYMNNLEKYINCDDLSDCDPLIKMAIIHHQFESIHPFHDGNGRTGRIINILYLVLKGLLDYPSLYLSRYINEHKEDYYRLLQIIRDNPDQQEKYWQEWIMFILKGIEETAIETQVMIYGIRDSMQYTKNILRDNLPKIYSQDLVNLIHSYPYTKTKHFVNELNISEQTARKYLESLVNHGILTKQKIWRENYYINHKLLNIIIFGN